MTSRSRSAGPCVVKLTEYAHRMFMYIHCTVQTLRCITWHYRQRTATRIRDRRPSAATRRRRAQRARQLTTQPRCRADTHAAARLRAPGRQTAASEQAPRRGTVARVPSRETGHHCLLCGLSFSPRGVAWSSICAVYTHSVSVQSESTQRKQYWPVSLEGNRVAV